MRRAAAKRRRVMFNVMDRFIARLRRNGLPMVVNFQYHPKIIHLHLMGKAPFFHRRHHLHRYKIPWFRYKKFQHLRPQARPRWCPRWMWREVEGHLKHPRGFVRAKAKRASAAARLDEQDYYDYDGQALDEVDDRGLDDDDFEDELPFMMPLVLLQSVTSLRSHNYYGTLVSIADEQTDRV